MNNGQKLNFAVYTKQLSQFDSYLQSNDVLKESGTLVFLTQDKSLYLDGVFYGRGTDPNSHVHDNIAILDNITSNDINAWDDAATNTHTHSNKSVLDGITSSDITNWNNKVDINHTHSYAGSSSAGGAATSANKLNTDAGNTNNPVYFSNGVPVATTYQLNKTVPSDAVFSDHTYNFAGTSFTSGDYYNGVHDCNSIKTNGVWYYTSNGPSTEIGALSTDGALYSQFHSANWGSQIAQDYRNGNLFVRGLKNNVWTDWDKIMTASNATNDMTYGSYLDVPIPFESPDVKAVIVKAFGGLMGGMNGNIPGFRDEITYRQAYSFTGTGVRMFDQRIIGTLVGSFNEFKYFKNITSLYIQTFYNQVSCTSLVVPEGVSFIGGQVFASFNGYIELPSTVTSIGNYTFWHNANITLKIHAITPPTITYGLNCYTLIKIMVPESALDTYKNDEQWGQYGDIYETF